MATYKFSDSPRYPTISVFIDVNIGQYTAPEVFIVISDDSGEIHRDSVDKFNGGGKVSYDFDRAAPLESKEYSFAFEVYEGDTLQETAPAEAHTLLVQSGKGSGGGGDTEGEDVTEFYKITAERVTAKNVNSEITESKIVQSEEITVNGDDVLTVADEGTLDSGTIDGREIYVQSSEPTSWSDGDIWLKPQ